MKRILGVLMLVLSVAMAGACQFSTQSEVETITGTLVFWRQQVFDHFEGLAVDSFDVVEIRVYVSSDEPEQYRIATSDVAAVKAQILAMFAKFDISFMFPGAPTDWANIEVDLSDGDETLTLRILVFGENDGMVGFVHRDASHETVSQGYPLDFFAYEIAAIRELVGVVLTV